MKKISLLLKTQQTVFTNQQLQLLLGYSNMQSLRMFLSRNAQTGTIKNVGYGLWALPHYEPYELGCKQKKHSYISLSTVLKRHGVIFQTQNNTITMIAEKSETHTFEDYTFEYHKIKDNILFSSLGIEKKNGYSIATAERALCDMAYLYKTVSIDSPQSINKKKLVEIVSLYPKRVSLLLNHLTHAS